MTMQQERRPIYRRRIPRHHDFDPTSTRRHNLLVHQEQVRINIAAKRRRVA